MGKNVTLNRVEFCFANQQLLEPSSIAIGVTHGSVTACMLAQNV